MRPVAGDAVGQHEVDEIAWLSRDRAAGKLSYQPDREVLTSLDRALNGSPARFVRAIVVTRHGGPEVLRCATSRLHGWPPVSFSSKSKRRE
jgi:hypothetical protein